MNTCLTILVPTRNRPDKLLQTLKELNEIYRKVSSNRSVEAQKIVISNNSDEEISLSDDFLLFDMLNITIIKPNDILFSAEENLLFGLKQIKSEYVWVLGDDDKPLYSGVLALLDELQAQPKILIFNSFATFSGKNTRMLRLDVPRYVNTLKFRDFVTKAGFWSVPAGFSTMVVRTSNLDFSMIDRWHSKNVKIYSHVGLWLHNFANEECKVVAEPLVEYNTNSYDSDNPDKLSKHWLDFGKLTNRPYRAPWTFDFFRILSDLIEANSFSGKELYVTLDQGHLGARFFLLDNMVSFFIDQLLYEMDNLDVVTSSNSEKEDFVKFMISVDAKLENTFRDIEREFLAKNDLYLIQLRKAFFSPDSQIERRLVYQISQGGVVESPFGYLWIRQGFSIHSNCKSLIQPRNVIYAPTLQTLENAVFLAIDNKIFQDDSHQLEIIQNQVEILGTALNRIKRIVPQPIRKILFRR